MRKEAASKGWKVLLVMLIACFACISLSGFSAKADTLGYDNFALSYYSDSSVSIKFNTGYVMVDGVKRHIDGRVEILDQNMNVLAQKEADSYANIPFSSAMNTVYYYRVTPFVTVGGVKRDIGEPSPVKAFSTIILKNKSSKSDRRLRVRCPKVNGVTNVKIMMSRSPYGGFHKIGQVKPGKTSRKMKKLPLNVTVYYYPEPVLASGVPCENVKVNSVRVYRVWRRG